MSAATGRVVAEISWDQDVMKHPSPPTLRFRIRKLSKECFKPLYGLSVSDPNVYGVLSMIIWALNGWPPTSGSAVTRPSAPDASGWPGEPTEAALRAVRHEAAYLRDALRAGHIPHIDREVPRKRWAAFGPAGFGLPESLSQTVAAMALVGPNMGIPERPETEGLM